MDRRAGVRTALVRGSGSRDTNCLFFDRFASRLSARLCACSLWHRRSFDIERGSLLLLLERDVVPARFLWALDRDLDLEAEFEPEAELELDPDFELPFVPRDCDALLSRVESPAVP